MPTNQDVRLLKLGTRTYRASTRSRSITVLTLAPRWSYAISSYGWSPSRTCSKLFRWANLFSRRHKKWHGLKGGDWDLPDRLFRCVTATKLYVSELDDDSAAIWSGRTSPLRKIWGEMCGSSFPSSIRVRSTCESFNFHSRGQHVPRGRRAARSV